MNNLRVGIRLAISFAVLVLIISAQGLLGNHLGNKTKTDLKEISDTRLPGIDALSRVSDNLRDAITLQRSLVVTNLLPDERAAIHRKIAAHRAEYRRGMETFESLPRTGEESDLWQQFLQALGEARAVNDAFLALSVRVAEEWDVSLFTGMQALLKEQAAPANEKLFDLLGRIVRMNHDVALQARTTAMDSLGQLRSGMWWAMGAGIGLACVIGSLLNRSISRPLRACAEFAGRVSKGDLNCGLDIRQHDETGRLAESMRTMVDTLKKMLAENRRKSEEAGREAARARQAVADAEEATAQAELARGQGMAEAASRMESVIWNLSHAAETIFSHVSQADRGARVQADHASRTASAMDQMSASVLEVARGAAKASEQAARTRGQALTGKEVAVRSLDAINRSRSLAQDLMAGMDRLGNQAQSVGQVLALIADIADQTNLLALNAAIEAARAGEAGKGFSVVAGEVRELAEKTMAATKEVAQAIGSIQGATSDNQGKAREAAKAVEEAAGLAAESSHRLDEIAALADAAADQVRAIAAAAQEQSAAGGEINRAVDEVAAIARDVAQGMRASSQAFKDMTKQTRRLEEVLGAFREGEADPSEYILADGSEPLHRLN